jgi:hypothetical protein
MEQTLTHSGTSDDTQGTRGMRRRFDVLREDQQRASDNSQFAQTDHEEPAQTTSESEARQLQFVKESETDASGNERYLSRAPDGEQLHFIKDMGKADDLTTDDTVVRPRVERALTFVKDRERSRGWSR